MSKLGFYNDNMFRAYPFVRENPIANEAAVDAAIVDAGFILGPEVRYNSNTDKIFLSMVSYEGGSIIFGFSILRQCAGEYTDYGGIVFSQNAFAPEFSPARLEAETTKLCINKFGDKDHPPAPTTQVEIDEVIKDTVIDGFLITGNLETLRGLLAGGGTLSIGYRLEPARVQNLNNTRVSSICVSNVKRVVIPPCKLAETCVDPFDVPEPEDKPPCIKFVVDNAATEQVTPIFIPAAPTEECDRDAAYQLVCDDQLVFAENYCVGCGSIKFVAGANIRLSQSTALNSITLTPGIAAGKTTRDTTLCDYNGEIPFTEKEAVAFAANEDEDGKPLADAVPPFWKDIAKEDFADIKPPIYMVADKEDPTNIEAADILRSDYLSGGWTCKGLVTTINGVSAPNVNLIAGTNIQIGSETSEDDDCEQVITVKITDTARGNCNV
jgi:hypothetical protein